MRQTSNLVIIIHINITGCTFTFQIIPIRIIFHISDHHHNLCHYIDISYCPYKSDCPYKSLCFKFQIIIIYETILKENAFVVFSPKSNHHVCIHHAVIKKRVNEILSIKRIF